MVKAAYFNLYCLTLQWYTCCSHEYIYSGWNIIRMIYEIRLLCFWWKEQPAEKKITSEVTDTLPVNLYWNLVFTGFCGTLACWVIDSSVGGKKDDQNTFSSFRCLLQTSTKAHHLVSGTASLPCDWLIRYLLECAGDSNKEESECRLYIYYSFFSNPAEISGSIISMENCIPQTKHCLECL